MPADMSPGLLSTSDTAVLEALFDPEGFSTASSNIDLLSNALPNVSEEKETRELQILEKDIISSLHLEEQPTKLAINTALERLTDIITDNPDYVSAYANIAQVRRLLLGSDEFSRANIGQLELVLSDLDTAIRLASPPSPLEPVSSLQAKILATCHTHRAYILYKLSKSRDMTNLGFKFVPSKVEQLEEAASRGFYMGGLYGNEVARKMSVATNPYSKLCGSIVKTALQKEIGQKIEADKAGTQRSHK
jgi:hypothetical protein